MGSKFFFPIPLHSASFAPHEMYFSFNHLGLFIVVKEHDKLLIEGFKDLNSRINPEVIKDWAKKLEINEKLNYSISLKKTGSSFGHPNTGFLLWAIFSIILTRKRKSLNRQLREELFKKMRARGLEISGAEICASYGHSIVYNKNQPCHSLLFSWPNQFRFALCEIREDLSKHVDPNKILYLQRALLLNSPELLSRGVLSVDSIEDRQEAAAFQNSLGLIPLENKKALFVFLNNIDVSEAIEKTKPLGSANASEVFFNTLGYHKI
jgi:hypothetical protein